MVKSSIDDLTSLQVLYRQSKLTTERPFDPTGSRETFCQTVRMTGTLHLQKLYETNPERQS